MIPRLMGHMTLPRLYGPSDKIILFGPEDFPLCCVSLGV